jgi:hypothetical protein
MNQSPDRSLRTRKWVIAVVLVGVLAALGWMWLGGRFGSRTMPATEEPGAAVTDPTAPPATEGAPDAADGVGDEAGERWTELMGSAPRWPSDFGAPEDCDGVEEELARVCAAFDARVPALRSHGGACTLVAQLGEALAAAPPDLASEIGSYDTIRRNVFHLFRVAGRDRLREARRALDEEELAEPAALAFYRWAITRSRCERPRSHPVRRESLYAYAGFLFNTLGGQAYLRRRSPRVEALACFYGLQVLDEAIRNGHNPQGLDPRPEIVRCRSLVGSQGLVFADRYVAELDAMAARWKGSGAGGP